MEIPAQRWPNGEFLRQLLSRWLGSPRRPTAGGAAALNLQEKLELELYTEHHVS